MTCFKVRQALSKMTMTSGLGVVMTLLLAVPKVSAHTNHPHNRNTEKSTPESVVESSDADETTVTAPVKQDTDAQSQEAQSQSLTPLVTQGYFILAIGGKAKWSHR